MKALTESARLSTDAASEYGEAGAIISLDQTLFVEVVLQLDQPGADQDAAFDTVDFITTNMSAKGEAAVNEWFENELDFPFTEAYYQSFYAAGDETIEASDAKFEEGAKNNTTGDKYVLVSTILVVQVVVVRPPLSKRSNRVLAGEDVPRSKTHLIYIALEVAKVLLLIALTVDLVRQI